MHPFRKAVETHDHQAVAALLAEDAVFLSPVAFSPYQGRAMVAAILRAADRVFEDFHYVREIADGRSLALMFKAQVGGREVHGCDFLELDDAGLITELCVMIRPLSAANAMAEAMGAQFPTIHRELAEEGAV